MKLAKVKLLLNNSEITILDAVLVSDVSIENNSYTHEFCMDHIRRYGYVEFGPVKDIKEKIFHYYVDLEFKSFESDWTNIISQIKINVRDNTILNILN